MDKSKLPEGKREGVMAKSSAKEVEKGWHRGTEGTKNAKGTKDKMTGGCGTCDCAIKQLSVHFIQENFKRSLVWIAGMQSVWITWHK